MRRTPLFRQEAIDAHRDTLCGGVLAAHQARWRTLTAAVALLTAGIVAFLFFGEYTRKERVSGYLLPTQGSIKIFTPQPGTIRERRVAEGQLVRKGDVLVVISSDSATASTLEAQDAILTELSRRRDSLAGEQIEQLEIDELAARRINASIAGLESELAQGTRQRTLLESRVQSAAEIVARFDKLGAQYVSHLVVQEKKDALLEARTQLASLERNLAAIERELHTARLDLAASALQRNARRSALERDISELRQEMTEVDARRTVVLTAPTDGRVTTILAEVGQMTTPSVPLLSLLPADGELIAHLLVPTRAAGFMRTNQTVALRYQAFPYQRFGSHLGTLSDISRTVIEPDQARLPLPVTEPVYLATVRLPAQQMRAYDQSMPLQAGMQLDADILIDRRSLIEWIFDPVLAVTGRL
jgi:membrane fusion protein